MRFRKLRIVWSVGCVIACLLLVVLWVRSYWRVDTVCYFHAFHVYGIDSERGNLLPFIQRSSARPDKVHFLSDRVVRREPATRRPPFSFSNQPSGYFAACIPIWFVILISAIFPIAPWIQWQFSLRTLLIAMTLVALLLGLAVYVVRK